MKSIIWSEDDQGTSFEYKDIPEDLQSLSDHWREHMLEAAAEANEEVMEKYLEGGELSEEEVMSSIRHRTLANEIVPVLCGSAFKNKGVQAVLDAVIDYMPAPTEVKEIEGTKEDGNETTCPADDNAPFASLAFKIATDPYVGTLTFFRVYSGTLNSGDSVYNPLKHKKERVGLSLIHISEPTNQRGSRMPSSA